MNSFLNTPWENGPGRQNTDQFYSVFKERSGSVVECLTMGPRVRASPASLSCVNY